MRVGKKDGNDDSGSLCKEEDNGSDKNVSGKVRG